MRQIFDWLHQFWLRRPLVDGERIILRAVRDKYPQHPKDVIFFVREDKRSLPVKSSALIQVWGIDGAGPWVHLTNLAAFMKDGMTIDEIKQSQI